MEKKIIIILFCLPLITSCLFKGSVSKGSETIKQHSDTIYFASENCLYNYSEVFLIEDAVQSKNYITLKASEKGKSIWIDSLLFKKSGQNCFFSIIRKPTSGYYILHYNEGVLTSQIISSHNCPKIDTNNVGKQINLTIRDSVRNSGYLNFITFDYVLSEDGYVLSDTSNFYKTPITID